MFEIVANRAIPFVELLDDVPAPTMPVRCCETIAAVVTSAGTVAVTVPDNEGRAGRARPAARMVPDGADRRLSGSGGRHQFVPVMFCDLLVRGPEVRPARHRNRLLAARPDHDASSVPVAGPRLFAPPLVPFHESPVVSAPAADRPTGVVSARVMTQGSCRIQRPDRSPNGAIPSSGEPRGGGNDTSASSRPCRRDTTGQGQVGRTRITPRERAALPFLTGGMDSRSQSG